MLSGSSSADLIQWIEDHLEVRHRRYAGAQFRAAFAGNQPQFVTAAVYFLEEHVPSRQERNYGSLLLAEEWVRGQSAAVDRLHELFQGGGRIEGHDIGMAFQFWNGGEQREPSLYGFSGWRFTVRGAGTASNQRSFEQRPLLAFGLPPYPHGPASAILDWVFKQRPSLHSATLSEENCMVVALPESRGSFTSAEWRPGMVEVEIELAVSSLTVELQMFFEGAENPHLVSPVEQKRLEVEVPNGTEAVHAYLVHQTNEAIAEIHLRRLYDALGAAAVKRVGERDAIEDLSAGENEEIEYKPFVRPMHSKENELIETICAFANSGGGRLYIGADDRGAPLGEQELTRCFNANPEEALKLQAERVPKIVREMMAPVPQIDVEKITANGQPLVKVVVQQGTSEPYATHDNKIFVRRGATNRLASPTEISAMMDRRSPLGLDLL